MNFLEKFLQKRCSEFVREQEKFLPRHFIGIRAHSFAVRIAKGQCRSTLNYSRIFFGNTICFSRSNRRLETLHDALHNEI